MTDCRYVWRPLSYLSRRDNRTQPVVLTPGSDKESARPEGAEDTVPLAHLSMQALGTTLYRPFRARSFWVANPGLKPRAESCRPFGTNCGNPTVRCVRCTRSPRTRGALTSFRFRSSTQHGRISGRSDY
jgi:hypothetical protein